jgi:hypothetical protein
VITVHIAYVLTQGPHPEFGDVTFDETGLIGPPSSGGDVEALRDTVAHLTDVDRSHVVLLHWTVLTEHSS